jgi:hypothetical protein
VECIDFNILSGVQKMNELIKQLAEQATSIQGPTPYNPLTFEVFDREKFAELIVRECINGIANDTANYEGVGMMSYYQGVQDAVKSIRKHFGVEG